MPAARALRWRYWSTKKEIPTGAPRCALFHLEFMVVLRGTCNCAFNKKSNDRARDTMGASLVLNAWAQFSDIIGTGALAWLSTKNKLPREKLVA